MYKFLFVSISSFVFSLEGPFNSYKALLDLAEKNISLSREQLLKISIPAMGAKKSQHQKDCEILTEYVRATQRALAKFQKSPSERNGFQQSEFVARFKELDQRFTKIFASQKTVCPSPAPKEEVKRSRRTQA